MQKKQEKKTLIIGAGVGGLATGFLLKKAGVTPWIYEKAAAPGGRIKLVERENSRVDAGVSFFNSNHVETMKLLEAVNLKYKLVKFNPWITMFRNEKRFMIKEKSVRQKQMSLWSNFRIFGIFRIVQKHFKEIDQYSNNELAGFEDIELTDFILKHYNREILEFFVRPAMNGHNLCEPEGESLAHFFRIIKQAMEVKHLYILPDGMIEFPFELAKDLNITYHANIEEVLMENNHVTGIKLVSSQGVKIIPADNVVCATPLKYLAELLPFMNHEEKTFVNDFVYSSYPSVIFFMKKRFSGKNWANVFSRLDHFTATATINATIKNLNMVPSGKTIIQMMFASKKGCDLIDLPDENLVFLAKQEMARVEPDFAREIEAVKVVRFYEGQPRFKVGTYSQLRGFLKNMDRIKGLHLVGDYHGHSMLETSIRSAKRAVKSILALMERNNQ